MSAEGGIAIGSRMRLSEGMDENTIFTLNGIKGMLPPIRNALLSLRHVQRKVLQRYRYQAVSGTVFVIQHGPHVSNLLCMLVAQIGYQTTSMVSTERLQYLGTHKFAVLQWSFIISLALPLNVAFQAFDGWA